MVKKSTMKIFKYQYKSFAFVTLKKHTQKTKTFKNKTILETAYWRNTTYLRISTQNDQHQLDCKEKEKQPLGI